ncbi:MAG TPA: hypothetical protein VHW44_24330 [Pseudonocardiaceae bacterium]|jgi:hypothetical protein|nr:hypothetical protein [Pseudonocardiaceae bacterium]
MGFWDAVKKGAEILGEGLSHQQTTMDLMEMSEAAGMIHLGVLVPRIIGEDWMDEFIVRLNNVSGDDERKAKSFRIHAEAIAHGEGWSSSRY